MTFVDAFAPDMVLGPDQVLPTVPRDFGERFDLNWKAARAPDKFFFYESRMMALWDDALDQLNRATGQTFPNPFRLAAGKQPRTGIFGEALPEALTRRNTARRDDVLPDILAAFDQARAGQFDLPDPRRFEDRIRGEAQKLRQDAERSALASYGAGGLGAFLGAAAGEMSHPVNLATLPIGGSYALGNIARIGLLRFLGRNALIEGGVAAASQAAIEALDAPYQEQLATDTGLADRIERILIAGAGGAALGLGLSGLAAAARGLRRGARMTLDEADALKVAERASFQERNPLGPDGANAHAKALDTAEVQVAAGRHADVREVVRDEVARQVQPRFAMSRLAPDEFKARVAEAARDSRVIGEMGDMAVGFVDFRRKEIVLGPDFEKLPRDQQRYIVGHEEGHLVHSDMLVDALRAADPEQKRFIPEMRAASKELRPKEWETAKAAGVLSIQPDGTVKVIKSRDLKKYLNSPGELVADAYAMWRLDPDRARALMPKVSKFFDDSVGEMESAVTYFDILDSAAATRPIADAAPVPPEKPPTGMKDAKADEARAMVLQKDFEMDVPSGDGYVKKMASEVLAEADERVKAAKLAAECAAGGAIG